MAIDPSEIRVGTTGTLYVAPVGTTLPTTTASALAAGFVDLGYISEDGPSLTPSMDVSTITPWQSFYPVKRIVTSRGMEWSFSLMQRNAATFPLAMGGGIITSLGAGDFKYSPPDPSVIDERSFVLEVRENDIIDRYVLERGMVTDLGDVSFKRDEATMFDVTISALASDDDEPWYLLTNDPAMDPA